MPKPKTKPDNKDAIIQNLESQVSELDTKWKRALADYQNLEKRSADQRAMFAKLATMSLIGKILSVTDDFERAAKHIEDPGLGMIAKQFSDILKEEGLEEIEAAQQTFDPLTMECVEVVEGEKDQVIRVAQKGYRLYDSVLRPAKVEVGGGITKDKPSTN